LKGAQISQDREELDRPGSWYQAASETGHCRGIRCLHNKVGVVLRLAKQQARSRPQRCVARHASLLGGALALFG
jgi:hypothetical protein